MYFPRFFIMLRCKGVIKELYFTVLQEQDKTFTGNLLM